MALVWWTVYGAMLGTFIVMVVLMFFPVEEARVEILMAIGAVIGAAAGFVWGCYRAIKAAKISAMQESARKEAEAAEKARKKLKEKTREIINVCIRNKADCEAVTLITYQSDEKMCESMYEIAQMTETCGTVDRMAENMSMKGGD